MHTPGPWEVGGDSGNEAEAEEIVASDGRRVIAWTCNTFDDTADDGYGAEVITEEDRANGRLIAAAPELLDALRNAKDELISLYERLYPDDESENDTTLVIDQAIAVIEKATKK
jgi:hypothetical protein